jgi:hypothetical protein
MEHLTSAVSPLSLDLPSAVPAPSKNLKILNRRRYYFLGYREQLSGAVVASRLVKAAGIVGNQADRGVDAIQRKGQRGLAGGEAE